MGHPLTFEVLPCPLEFGGGIDGFFEALSGRVNLVDRRRRGRTPMQGGLAHHITKPFLRCFPGAPFRQPPIQLGLRLGLGA